MPNASVPIGSKAGGSLSFPAHEQWALFSNACAHPKSGRILKLAFSGWRSGWQTAGSCVWLGIRISGMGATFKKGRSHSGTHPFLASSVSL